MIFFLYLYIIFLKGKDHKKPQTTLENFFGKPTITKKVDPKANDKKGKKGKLNKKWFLIIYSNDKKINK